MSGKCETLRFPGSRRLPRVVLVEVPSDNRKSVLTNPLGLSTIKGVLQKRFPGIDVSIVLGQQLSHKKTTAGILSRNPDIVGYSVKPYSLPNLRAIDSALRTASGRKRPLSVLGHATPTFAPKELLKDFPRAIMVRGDGEYPMAGLVRRFIEGADLREIPGISFIDRATNTLTQTKAEPFDLKEAPELDFPLFKEIYDAGGEIWLEASRVCAHRCRFCVENEAARGLPRREMPESYIEYLVRMMKKHGIGAAHFSDSDFLGQNFGRALRIASMFRSAGDLRFMFDARADEVVDAEREHHGYWKKMKEAGLTQVFVGFESMSPSQLKRYNKGTTVAQNRKAKNILLNAGIYVATGNIIFDPWLTMKELRENIAGFEDLKSCFQNFSFLPLKLMHRMRLQKGSELFEEAQRDGLLTGPTEDPIFWNSRFRDPGISLIADAAADIGRTFSEVEAILRPLSRFEFNAPSVPQRSIYAIFPYANFILTAFLKESARAVSGRDPEEEIRRITQTCKQRYTELIAMARNFLGEMTLQMLKENYPPQLINSYTRAFNQLHKFIKEQNGFVFSESMILFSDGLLTR